MSESRRNEYRGDVNLVDGRVFSPLQRQQALVRYGFFGVAEAALIVRSVKRGVLGAEKNDCAKLLVCFMLLRQKSRKRNVPARDCPPIACTHSRSRPARSISYDDTNTKYRGWMKHDYATSSFPRRINEWS